MISIKTIRQGTRVAVWDTGGRVRYVDSPARLWLFRETVQPVARHSAAADEYLARHRAETEFKRETNALALAHTRARKEAQTDFLGALKAMQVDLTHYLVAQYRHPDRLIRIDGIERGQLHVHNQ